MPPLWVVGVLLMGLGERGWLAGAQTVLVGQPKAWDFAHLLSVAEQSTYRQQQRAAVVLAVRRYNTRVPIVQNLDFRHTDPQLILLSGRLACVFRQLVARFFTYQLA